MRIKPVDNVYFGAHLPRKQKEMEQPDEKIATSADLQAVELTLAQARPHRLEAEVMWSALTMAAEANEHGLTMEQVLEAALGEWDI
jgi:hypothetical protein